MAALPSAKGTACMACFSDWVGAALCLSMMSAHHCMASTAASLVSVVAVSFSSKTSAPKGREDIYPIAQVPMLGGAQPHCLPGTVVALAASSRLSSVQDSSGYLIFASSKIVLL